MEESWGKLDDEAAINLSEMMHLKRQGQSSAADGFRLPRQGLPLSPYTFGTHDAAAHIKVGSYYEIDHSKLPSQTPDQLKPIRIIMVSKKSKYNVSLRFPSLFSLRAHFRDENFGKPEGKMLPSLDEKYVMESELAGEVLYRRIPPHEIAVQRNLWSFWVVPLLRKPDKEKSWSLYPATNTFSVKTVAKYGSLLSELRSTRMIRWGSRRQVRFLRRHVEQQRENITSSNFKDKEEERDEENEQSDDEDQGKEEEEEEKTSDKSDKEKVETDDESDEKRKSLRKRKVSQCRYRTEQTKKAKLEKQNHINDLKQRNRKALKTSISRWSLERYKLAEKNMLKILKEKSAVFGNPILRPALRTEARKLIGDTGLLDHLLKHMAGKVAPGGEERFRRRHNADGAMEYWLEKADLLNIRKEAGVQDPYWIPPPGWTLGDHPTQDPICAREQKELRQEMAKLKREVQELRTQKQEEDLAIVPTPDSSVAGEIMGHASSLLPLKEKYIDLVNKKAKIEEQLMEISQSLCGMEEEMSKLKSVVEEQNKPASEEMPQDSILLQSTSSERKTAELNLREEKETGATSGEEQNISQIGEETQAPPPETIAKAGETTGDKSAKIERLKSGFRVCKPQGSFLWPNMSLSPQGGVPLDGLLAVHTPPSVSSSTASAPHYPNSPVKTFAERQPVTDSLSPKSVKATHSPPPLAPPETTQPTITTTKTTLINLNEIPVNNINTGFCRSSNLSHSSASAVTYHRRHQNLISATTMPHLLPSKKEDKMGQLNGRDSQQQRGCSASSPCKFVGAKTWWALATSSSSLNNN